MMKLGAVVPASRVLEVRSLTKAFGDFVAVDNVSFAVKRGSFVSLLGPSGSGKTTILRIVAGFESPAAGEVFLNGEPMSDRRPYQRDVSTVFQNYALFPHMSVIDNIAFGLQCRRLPQEEIRQRVGQILDLTQLAGKEQRRIQTLSGGEQQRVALARSLVTNPALLLLDEPLGALDLKLRRDMAAELKRLHQRLNMTFLYVTHDQEEALSMSDRVIVMHRGTIRQVGTPDDIYWRPNTTFVADFLGGANVLTGTVVESRDDLLRVALGGSAEPTVLATAREPVDVGSPVSIALRGERLAVGHDAEGKDTRTTGTVEDIRFYGSLTELEVRLVGGQALRVRGSGALDSLKVAVGEQIAIGWNAQEAITIERDLP